MNSKVYLLKDISSMTGLSVYTIKYYLNLGLIKESGRSPETNFRYFDDRTAQDLKKIIAYKKQHMSLAKISDLLKGEAR